MEQRCCMALSFLVASLPDHLQVSKHCLSSTYLTWCRSAPQKEQDIMRKKHSWYTKDFYCYDSSDLNFLVYSMAGPRSLPPCQNSAREKKHWFQLSTSTPGFVFFILHWNCIILLSTEHFDGPPDASKVSHSIILFSRQVSHPNIFFVLIFVELVSNCVRFKC